jgi:hypothetical protein
VLVFVAVGEELEERELRDVVATPAVRATAPPLIRLKLIEDRPVESIELLPNPGSHELSPLVMDWKRDPVGMSRLMAMIVEERETPGQMIRGAGNALAQVEPSRLSRGVYAMDGHRMGIGRGAQRRCRKL